MMNNFLFPRQNLLITSLKTPQGVYSSLLLGSNKTTETPPNSKIL